MTAKNFIEEFIPSKEDTKLAKEAVTTLAQTIGRGNKTKSEILFHVAKKEQRAAIPQGILELVMFLLNETALGHSVTLIPSHKDLTTQEAADLLNVSRPFVVKLLEEGKIPFRKIGAHRRIRFVDLMKYKQISETEQIKAFNELAKLSQDLKLGYD